MVKIEKILVPVDFSPSAEVAREHAAQWAARFGAALHFLHVWRVPWYLDPQLPTLQPSPYPDLASLARSKANAAMARFIWPLERRAGLALQSLVTDGTPRNVILETAALRRYDLIVMGTNGRTGLAHLFLGSTAEGVVRRAPCPVLTIRAPGRAGGQGPAPAAAPPEEAATAPGPYLRPRKILVPVDFSEGAAAALDLAVQLGQAFQAAVDVLHVLELPSSGAPLLPGPGAGGGPQLPEEAIRVLAARLEKRVAPARAAHPALQARVVAGYPRDAILAAVEEGGYDLAVVGTNGRTGLAHFFLGSVAEQVVCRATCPVLTLHSPAIAP